MFVIVLNSCQKAGDVQSVPFATIIWKSLGDSDVGENGPMVE